ncbi:hypothetical protein D3C78_1460800 [compost metagenome]
MKENLVFLKPLSLHAYRRPNCDIPLITGVVHIEPWANEGRICYELTYEDGFIDHVPVNDVMLGYYRFVAQ